MAKANEVAKTTTNALAGLEGYEDLKITGGEGIDGLENLDPSDIKIPKIKIVQLTSQEVADGKARPGQFYNSLTQEATDTVECVLLQLGKTRVAWEGVFKRGEEPKCRSFDGIRSASGQLCSKCKLKEWGANNEKPECNQGYTWLAALDNGEYTPFRIIASGTSVSPTKDFLNVLAQKRYPIYVFRIVLSTEKKQNEQGTYYVIKYQFNEDENGIQPVPREHIEILKGMKEGLAELFATAQMNDIIDIESEGGETGENSELF